MRTFHNDPALKDSLFERFDAIAQRPIDLAGDDLWADYLPTLEDPVSLIVDDDSDDCFSRYGLPGWLGMAEHALHLGVPDDRRAAWPYRFIQAIPVGIDDARLEREVAAPLLATILRRSLTTFDADGSPAVRRSIEAVTRLWERDDLRSPDWLAAFAAAGETTWAAISPCPLSEKRPDTRWWRPAPGQEGIAATFAASMMAAEMVGRPPDGSAPAEQSMRAALSHCRADGYALLIEELIRLLGTLEPVDRGGGMLTAVRAAAQA